MTSCEVVIIGGSLAGSACAIALRNHGVEAVVFDRQAFPREKVCGAFLSPGAVDRLDALGLLGEVLRSGARRVDRIHLRVADRLARVDLPEPGLGFSRQSLDAILARRAGVRELHSVEAVRSAGGGFAVEVRPQDGPPESVSARVVVDAAGRFSRFTPRRGGAMFGVQWPGAVDPGPVLEFGVFAWGYGGTVAVEGGRSNSCFLVGRPALRRFLDSGACRVTGPIACDAAPGPWLAIGDAAGMVDPFSGGGMHHALATGEEAAAVIAAGLGKGWSYAEIRNRYEAATTEDWKARRRLGAWLRRWIDRSMALRLASAGLAIPGVAELLVHALLGRPQTLIGEVRPDRSLRPPRARCR